MGNRAGRGGDWPPTDSEMKPMPLITETIDNRFVYPERARALMAHLNLKRWTEVDENPWCNEEYSAEGCEYQVLTDDEANALWEQALDSYLDECVLPELPEFARMYFDEEAWKRDARHDGRAHAINSYDGSENEECDPVTGEMFVIYRTN